jgi:hypothetical protein
MNGAQHAQYGLAHRNKTAMNGAQHGLAHRNKTAMNGAQHELAHRNKTAMNGAQLLMAQDNFDDRATCLRPRDLVIRLGQTRLGRKAGAMAVVELPA